MEDPINKNSIIYLSRRNLEALLSKLNRSFNGEETQCTIIKVQQPSSAYRQTMREILVVAVDDKEYYALQARPAGEMCPLDEASLTVPSTGIINSSTIR